MWWKEYQKALLLNENLIQRIERLEKKVDFLSENRLKISDEVGFKKYIFRVYEGDLYLVKDKIGLGEGINPSNIIVKKDKNYKRSDE